MGCIKLDILNQENTGLKVVYRKVKAEPKVMQWFYGVDPMSHKYTSHGGYNYVLNNPLSKIDLNGMEVTSISGGVRFTEEDAVSAFKILTGRSKNALVYIEHNDKSRNEVNSNNKNYDNGGWSVFAVKNLELGAKAISVLKDFSLDNLVISNHGNSDQQKSFFQFDDTIDNLSSSNSVNTDDIYKYNNGIPNNNVEAIKSMTEKVKDGGNCVLAFCYTGGGAAGEYSLRELNKLTNQRLNIHLPRGKASLPFQTWEKYGKVFNPNRLIGNNWISSISGKADFRSTQSIAFVPNKLSIIK
jgi:hypothetical protein